MKKIGQWLKKNGIAIGVSVGMSFAGFFAFLNTGTSGTKAGGGIGKDTIIVIQKPDTTKAK